MRTETTFLNFDLHFKGSGKAYQAQISDEVAGQISIDFDLPFSDLELEDFLLYISQSHWATPHLNSVLLEAIQEFGDQLFQAVFTDPLQDQLQRRLRMADEQAAKFRLRLHLAETPALAQLPWEYLYHSSKNFFFAVSPKTSLVRYQDVSEARPILTAKLPLKVLVVVSAPKDHPPIDAHREWLKLRQSLSLLEQHGLIVLEHLVDATLETLRRQLGLGKYHIIHFIGYADKDGRTDDSWVLLQDDGGLAQPVSGQMLGQLLLTEKTLRLAFLNTATYQSPPIKNPLTNLAQTLIQTGLPAAIMAPLKMTETATTTLNYALYRALAEGNQADVALDRARRLILAQENGVEWGRPLLYTCCPDGRLFNISEAEAIRQVRRQINDIYSQTLAAYSQQDWGTVAQKLHTLLGMDPTHPEAIFLLRQIRRDHLILTGQSERQNHRLAEMWARFYAIELDFGEKHRLNTLANLFKEAQVAFIREDWSTAAEKLEACLKLAPTNPKLTIALKRVQQQAHLGRLYQEGKAHYEAGDWQQALVSLRKVQEIDGSYKEVKALVFTIEGHIRRQQVAAFYMDIQALLFTQGLAHYNARRWSEALKCFRQIEQTGGSNPQLKRMITQAERHIALEKVRPTSASIRANFGYGLAGAGLKWGVLPLAIVLVIIWLSSLLCRLNSGLTQSLASSPSQVAAATIPVAQATFTPTSSPTSPPTNAPQCRVISAALDLQSGPSPFYASPLLTLSAGALLTPLARNPTGDWIRVHVVDTRQVGWVSAGSGFVNCNVNIPDLALGYIPPLPTTPSTSVSSQSATSTPSPIGGDCVTYDPNTLQVLNEGARGWLLIDGQTRLRLYDTQAEAAKALAEARQHDALCFINAEKKKGFFDSFIKIIR